MVEIWLPAPGYAGLYEISNLGRVRSLYSAPPRLLALSTDQSGYLMVQMNRNGKRKPHTVHRLVCRAFHGEPPDAVQCEAAHLDGDRSNAQASNLKWVSKAENHSHKRLHGTHGFGEQNGHHKLQESEASAILLAKGHRAAKDLAESFSVSVGTVYDIWKGRRWPHLMQTPNTSPEGPHNV